MNQAGEQEDLKAFVMDNWAPTLQAAFGEQWREQLEAEVSDSGRLRDGILVPSHVFEGLLPKSLIIADPGQAGEASSSASGHNVAANRRSPAFDGGSVEVNGCATAWHSWQLSSAQLSFPAT